MKLKERINKVLEYSGKNISEFSRFVGFKTPQAVRELTKGNTKSLSEAARIKILSAFPEIDEEWLLTGEGSMLKSITDGAPAATAASVGSVDGVVLVPLVEIDSVGGMHSRPLIEPSEQYVSERISLPGARAGDVAIRQSGNSMFPTIPSGAVLLIRCVEDWREYLGYGETYVLLLADGRRLTKQVRRYAPDPEHYVLCASFNPDYDDEELPRSLIRQVWRVVAVVLDHGW